MNAWGRTIDAWCDVRSLANGRRGACEVVHTVMVAADGSHTRGVPYDPIIMPEGLWMIGRPEASEDPETEPWFIPVGCAPEVAEWSVVYHGDTLCYGKPTGRKVLDSGYALHSGDMALADGRTLGCIFVPDVDEISRIADYRFEAIKERRDTVLRVLGPA